MSVEVSNMWSKILIASKMYAAYVRSNNSRMIYLSGRIIELNLILFLSCIRNMSKLDSTLPLWNNNSMLELFGSMDWICRYWLSTKAPQSIHLSYLTWEHPAVRRFNIRYSSHPLRDLKTIMYNLSFKETLYAWCSLAFIPQMAAGQKIYFKILLVEPRNFVKNMKNWKLLKILKISMRINHFGQRSWDRVEWHHSFGSADRSDLLAAVLCPPCALSSGLCCVLWNGCHHPICQYAFKHLTTI